MDDEEVHSNVKTDVQQINNTEKETFNEINEYRSVSDLDKKKNQLTKYRLQMEEISNLANNSAKLIATEIGKIEMEIRMCSLRKWYFADGNGYAAQSSRNEIENPKTLRRRTMI